MSLSASDIDLVVQKYDQATKALKEELFKICWFMRGGVTYNESLYLTADDRKIITSIIEGNLEITKETGHPFF